MCDFLLRLNTLFLSSVACEKDFHRSLATWNDDIEIFVQSTVQKERVGTPVHDTIVDGDAHIDPDSVAQTFLLLRILFMGVVSGNNFYQSYRDIANGTHQESTYQIYLDAVANDWRYNRVSAVEKIQFKDICTILRTTKNCWRCYIQLYLPSKRKYGNATDVQQKLSQQDLETSWRSKPFLEMLLNVLEALSLASLCNNQHQIDNLRNGSQCAAQLFFYVTYPMPANTLSLRDSYHYMVTECNLMERFLSIIIERSATMQLQLSIIRNVHNALASFPQQSTKAVKTAIVDVSIRSTTYQEWIKDERRVTYNSFLRDLVLYVLSVDDKVNHKVGLPDESYDGTANLRAELMVEILRCCYALRIGLEYDDEQNWSFVIGKVLQLDSAKNVHNFDCKLAVTCILMESPMFRKVLSSNSVASLMDVLNQQAGIVIQENYIDDRAAAALNPILAVMYKLCVESPDNFAATIRENVFPKKSSDFEGERICEQQDFPKNMSPIDAPEGTLRWRLIKLLTWPNSFVKRLTGELLFVLCHSKQQEFIRRVGIGNAVTLLSLKGLIDLPPSVHS
jgi:hypothetical protein